MVDKGSPNRDAFFYICNSVLVDRLVGFWTAVWNNRDKMGLQHYSYKESKYRDFWKRMTF